MKSTATTLFLPYALETDKKLKAQDDTYMYIIRGSWLFLAWFPLSKFKVN